MEGRFIADRIEGLSAWCEQEVIHLQLKRSPHQLYYSRKREKGFSQLILQSRWIRWKWLEALAPKILLQELKRVEVGRFDIMVVHVAYPILVNFRDIRRHIACPVILSEHWSAYHNRFYLPESSPALSRMRNMLDSIDGLIVVSRALDRDIRSLCDFSGPSEVVPNPVDGKLFSLQEDAVRSGFIAVNRWVKIKQPFVLLEAWMHFVREHPTEVLTIVGDGPEIPSMKGFVSSNQLNGSVRFSGAQQPHEVARMMKHSKAVIASSQYETFSLSCAEALMCGTPLIAVKLEAVQEYAGAGDAVFSDGTTSRDLLRAMREFIARDVPWDYAEISRRAHARFERHASDELYFRSLSHFASRS
jgi:L-malate glycosyltransferase